MNSKNYITFLISCKDKKNCEEIKKLRKEYKRNIREVHETIPFTDINKIRSRIIDKDSVKVTDANFIIEVETKRYSELDKIKTDFQNSFTPQLASIITT